MIDLNVKLRYTFMSETFYLLIGKNACVFLIMGLIVINIFISQVFLFSYSSTEIVHDVFSYYSLMLMSSRGLFSRSHQSQETM